MHFFRIFLFVLLQSSAGAFAPTIKRAQFDLVPLTTLSSEKSASEVKTEVSKQDPLNNKLTVHFYGSVSEETCLSLTQSLLALDLKARQLKVFNEDIEPVIELHIQSPGGALMPTFFVCDTIKNLRTPVHTYVDGFCASAASIISVCGKKRFMTKHSSILIHQLTGAAAGKFNELKNEVNNLNFFMEKVKDIYLTNTRLEEEKLQELLESDVWLDSKTCLSYGLIDEIL